MPKKLTKNILLDRFENIHIHKYDYSLFDIYENNTQVISIICKEHGIFKQRVDKHLNGQGCPKCSGKNKTIDDVKLQFNLKHHYKYDYSLLLNYKNNRQIVDIICPIHGIFQQSIYKHMFGQQCPKCSNVYMPTNEEFVNKCEKLNVNKYDYSLVEYENNKSKIKIICPTHGIFEQTANNHLSGQQCPYCIGNKTNTYFFINKSNDIHNNKYTYNNTKYIDSKTNVTITCSIHGDFKQNPNSHLKGFGCSKCSGLDKLTTEEFINKSKIINIDKYDYSLVDYINNKTKVKLICKIHGVFEQNAGLHLREQGCPKCSGKNRTIEDIIELFNDIHNNKYDYSLTEYINSKLKIKIICPRHGVFEQSTSKHLRGQGCPICNLSKGENIIIKLLNRNNIKFIRQYSFVNCKYIKKLQFDFYLPYYNTCIEFDGIQHYKPIDFFGGIDTFDECKIKDKIKTNYCKNNNINLIRIPYYDDIEKYLIFQ